MSDDTPAPIARRGRVLLVDDDFQLLDLLEKVIANLGYAVGARADPEDALKAFQTAPAQWDILLADQTMPQMSGLDLIAQVKRVRPDLPVILMSGFSDLLTEQQRLNAGIAAVLSKPVLARELAQALNEAMAPQDPETSS